MCMPASVMFLSRLPKYDLYFSTIGLKRACANDLAVFLPDPASHFLYPSATAANMGFCSAAYFGLMSCFCKNSDFNLSISVISLFLANLPLMPIAIILFTGINSVKGKAFENQKES